MTRQEAIHKVIHLRALAASTQEEPERKLALSLADNIINKLKLIEDDIVAGVPTLDGRRAQRHGQPGEFGRSLKKLRNRVEEIKRRAIFRVRRDEWSVQIASIEAALDKLIAQVDMESKRLPRYSGQKKAISHPNKVGLVAMQRRYM
jgi:hypothetical protein